MELLRKSTYGFRALVLDFCVPPKFPFKIFGREKNISTFTSRYLITVKNKKKIIVLESSKIKTANRFRNQYPNHLKL
jgi:hypothetical protein